MCVSDVLNRIERLVLEVKQSAHAVRSTDVFDPFETRLSTMLDLEQFELLLEESGFHHSVVSVSLPCVDLCSRLHYAQVQL